MNRRLPLILVAGVLALCLIGVIVVGATAGSGFGAVAYTVDDSRVSQVSVKDDLAALADHPKLASGVFGVDPFATTAGAVSSTGAASWLTLRVELDILRAAPGAKPSASDLTAARKSLLDQLKSSPTVRRDFLGLPSSMQDAIVEINVYSAAAQSSPARNRQLARAIKRAHVTVDPKYGFWNRKRLAVCPPTGCPAPSASASAGG
jgi:hypothetical protein